MISNVFLDLLQYFPANNQIEVNKSEFLLFLGAQFERCLDQLFSVNLNKFEIQSLLLKYGGNPQQKGMICYRDFCSVIDAS